MRIWKKHFGIGVYGLPVLAVPPHLQFLEGVLNLIRLQASLHFHKKTRTWASLSPLPQLQPQVDKRCPNRRVSMSLNDVWDGAAGSPFYPLVSKDRQFLVGFSLLFIGGSESRSRGLIVRLTEDSVHPDRTLWIESVVIVPCNMKLTFSRSISHLPPSPRTPRISCIWVRNQSLIFFIPANRL